MSLDLRDPILLTPLDALDAVLLLLPQFLIVLTVVFIIELVIEISMAVLAFTAQEYISNTLKTFWQSFVETYKPSDTQKQIVDHIQIGVSEWCWWCNASRLHVECRKGAMWADLTGICYFLPFFLQFCFHRIFGWFPPFCSLNPIFRMHRKNLAVAERSASFILPIWSNDRCSCLGDVHQS